MTERTLPTNTCSKCGKSMGLSHQCGLEQDVEIRPDIIETIFTPESIVKCLRELADVWKTNVQDGIVCMVAADTIDQQAEQLDTMEDALRQIDSWAQAYPLEVFPKLDFKRAHAVLTAHGMTLDSISADSMRHVLEEIKGIVAEALKDGA